MASQDQYRWNQGRDGEPKRPQPVERPGSCSSALCGVVAGPGPAPAGMTRVRVRGSREPARNYCKGFCASYGEALAELRPEVTD